MSRPLNEDRQAAITLGYRTYTGAPHSKCGTTERYTGTGGCVHCARRIATEQREALKYVKAQEAAQVRTIIEDGIRSGDVIDGDFELDNLLPTELEPDDAVERLRHSIDELM